jgi:V8-like Glu-specific endopeptidase
MVVFEPSHSKIGYAISTLPGQSGSPIIFDQKIIAIHNGGGRKDE